MFLDAAKNKIKAVLKGESATTPPQQIKADPATSARTPLPGEKYKLPKKRPKKANERIVYCVKNGAGWNPLLAFPRNLKCFCGSNEKAKRCCLPYSPRALGEHATILIRQHWEQILSGEIHLPPAPNSPRAAFENRNEKQAIANRLGLSYQGDGKITPPEFLNVTEK